MVVSPSTPDSTPPSSSSDPPRERSLAWRVGRILLLVCIYMAFWMGLVGSVASLLTLLVPGRIENLKLRGTPVETVSEKLTAAAGFFVFFVVGLVGLRLRRRMRQKREASA